MPIGPVQLIALGFARPGFQGRVAAELERLRGQDAVRVLDALAVFKDAGGGLEVEHLGPLSRDEAAEAGSRIGALIGLDIEGDAPPVPPPAGPGAGAGKILAEDAWDVLEEIPHDSAAALLLLEHHWAVPLRDAIAREGGHHISDGFVSPFALVAIGLHTAEEAARLHRLENAGENSA
ncbi:hypothetical protein AGRA3207_003689 [Actinomadura graeca]|uniref:DUF1269 domain-containing protein n=1 Tax=Actinomadura graeca TaxID=2750812 RepID=A0ABX8QV99_9ACTN|nr:hypothetical protein [Actinomadura graeca]QXJ22652.1 hypothetical protein AGRA3207_003689 [Actinomadura graeca]